MIPNLLSSEKFSNGSSVVKTWLDKPSGLITSAEIVSTNSINADSDDPMFRSPNNDVKFRSGRSKLKSGKPGNDISDGKSGSDGSPGKDGSARRGSPPNSGSDGRLGRVMPPRVGNDNPGRDGNRLPRPKFSDGNPKLKSNGMVMDGNSMPPTPPVTTKGRSA